MLQGGQPKNTAGVGRGHFAAAAAALRRAGAGGLLRRRGRPVVVRAVQGRGLQGVARPHRQEPRAGPGGALHQAQTAAAVLHSRGKGITF